MRQCAICGKGYKRVFARSHSHRATIKKLQINLQWTKFAGRRVKACTQCIKSLGKGKPVKAAA
ncbi:MAG: 50S ribosomal protein L28 [Patescibacteria group bacterium]|nr:50S ribosomal protein L28 [Patescibacteria group bacterium]